MTLSKPKYEKLLADIGLTIERARENAVRAINTELVKANCDKKTAETLIKKIEKEWKKSF